jgi:uncharacterized protein
MLLLYFLSAIVLIDCYTLKGVFTISKNLTNIDLKHIILATFIFITFTFIVAITIGYVFRPHHLHFRFLNKYSYLIGWVFVFYIPKLVIVIFQLVGDFFEGLLKLAKWISAKYSPSINEKLRRLKQRHIPLKTGMILSLITFFVFIYGMAYGRFNYQVERVKLTYPSLPSNFNHFKIVQISDLHVGGYYGYFKQLRRAINLINKEKPDLILFTGDLVTLTSNEEYQFTGILDQMKARIGKYSILGNHDYGDYYNWDSPAEKGLNFEKMLQAHESIGFKLLRNQSKLIKIGDQQIALIGVDNWGLPPFPEYGDLHKAMKGLQDSTFKILLSHDPSHWSAQVIGKTNIELTLSGHTHGMQMGIHLGNFRWSPVEYKYPRWAGLYQAGKQFLYVNRGLGFIVYPGRFGSLPEITVIELSNGN